MKKQKGVTLVGLVIYIVVILVVAAMVGTISINFYDKVVGMDKSAQNSSEFDKFNMYFSNDINKPGNKVITATGNKIVFTSGSQYTYINDQETGEKNIFLNNIRICTNVDECVFEYDDANKIIKVHISIGIDPEKRFSKDIEYKLVDDKENNTVNSEYVLDKNLITTRSEQGLLSLENNKVGYVDNYRIYGKSITNSDGTISSIGDNGKVELVVIGKNLFDIRKGFEMDEGKVETAFKIDFEYQDGKIYIKGTNEFDNATITIKRDDDDWNQFFVSKLAVNDAKYVCSYGGAEQFIYKFMIKRQQSGDEWTYPSSVIYSNDIIEIKPYMQAKNLVSGINFDTLFWCMLEKNDTATEFEPYKEKIITIDLTGHEPLRSSVDNTVSDHIDLKQGAIIRKVDSNRNVLQTEVIETIDVPSFSVYGYKHIYVNDEKIDDSLIEMTYSI